MVTLKDIFNVWYGVNLEVVNSEVVEKGIPFVSRQSVNNGVVCHVAPIDGVTPNPANTLSIAVSGSVLSTFYHDYPYYSGRDVYVAEPKEPMTKEEMLYYAYIIEQNKYRYNYGRGANRTFRDIVVPDRNEIPKYVEEYKAEFNLSKDSIITCGKSLNTDGWKEFTLDSIFIIKRGKTLSLDQKEDFKGDIPCVNGTSTGNGILCYLNEEIEQYGFCKMPTPSLSLCRVGTSGLTFVQTRPYYIADNAFCLQLKEKQNFYVYLFLSTILDKECYKYSYGRTIGGEKYMRTIIKLPVTAEGKPDWQFMENYIKSLPYSKNLEPIDSNILVDEILEYKKKIASLEHQLQEQKHSDIHYHINAENISLQTDGTINIGEINEK